MNINLEYASIVSWTCLLRWSILRSSSILAPLKMTSFCHLHTHQHVTSKRIPHHFDQLHKFPLAIFQRIQSYRGSEKKSCWNSGGTKWTHTFLASLQSRIAWMLVSLLSLHRLHFGLSVIFLRHLFRLVSRLSWAKNHKNASLQLPNCTSTRPSILRIPLTKFLVGFIYCKIPIWDVASY